MKTTCQCSDPGCPHCKGHCSNQAQTVVRRIDMEDRTEDFKHWLSTKSEKVQANRKAAFNKWRTQTDSIEYAHFVWWTGHRAEHLVGMDSAARLKVI